MIHGLASGSAGAASGEHFPVENVFQGEYFSVESITAGTSWSWLAPCISGACAVALFCLLIDRRPMSCLLGQNVTSAVGEVPRGGPCPS